MRILENIFCLNARRYFKYLFVLLVLISFQSQAQRKIDSLQTVLQNNLPDSTRANVLVALSQEYAYVDVAKSRALSEEAISLAENTDLPRLKSIAYRNMGDVYRVSGDYSSALRLDNMSLESSMLSQDTALIARSYNNVAHDYLDLGEYDESYYYFTQGYKFAKAVRDSFMMAITIHNVGRVFKELEQYNRALDHFQISQKMSSQIKDLEGEPYSLNEIGDVLLRQGNYDSALITLFASLKQSRQFELIGLLPKTMSSIAKTYMQKGDFDTSLKYYDTTYTLYSKNKDNFGLAEVELGRGVVYQRQQRYDDALQSITKSLNHAQKLNARILEIQCFNQLSSLWEMKGDYKKSLEYFKRYKELEDTLFSQDMQAKLLRDQIRFETESKDSQIKALAEQQTTTEGALKRQEFVRNVLIVIMALSVLMLISVYRSGQRRRQINTLLLRHQQETEKRSEELERLNQVKDKFFSIISHDLRSPINALSGLLDLLDKGAVSSEELPKHIRELKNRFNHTRALLNNLLDWTLLQMDKLNLQKGKIDLKKLVDENIQLLGETPGKEIKLINDVAPNTIGFADSNTINLVIRNLITNAIKFTNDKGEVRIAAKPQGNEWLVSVKDNGIGMTTEVLRILFDKTSPYTTRGTANEKGTGLGLILCKEFVEKNGGKIWVESAEDYGSTFYFTLPKAEVSAS
ncbi:tetratricopeptide repeat-containing sensor histidine kinase [Chryseolinea sp. H1M3-3]|uniref:tetratricopeptide repeat-containing sensor histidine kinase n=1 Tax=Chryseolinea sp. H1M3-3 TaxID=3034144 RepID=UPI0023EAE63C|nr:tetratricopeptide repeat-containing sensor histidine kinase [Chryseolinea sp. H1M3-3]